jgi:nucleoside-diphosphate-sugar epimerase
MLNLIFKNAQRNIDVLDFSSLNNKKILLTGTTGLIGVHLLSTLILLKKIYNIEIYCLTNDNIDEMFLPLYKDCFIIKGNLVNSKSIDKLLDIFSENLWGVDYIIHSAGYGQPKKFTDDKVNTILINTKVTCELFKLLNPGGSFLYCSTSEIYNGIEEKNIDESRIGTTTPDHPRSCYIDSKRCGESILHGFSEKGYNTKIARISLAYGPGTKKNDERVLNNFIQKAIQNKSINMLDDGSSIRTYGHVSDITEMLWNIFLHGKDITYNVAGVSEISILELAKNIGYKLNCNANSPKNNSNELKGNPKVVNLSLNKYFQEFGEKKYIPLNEGLTDTIQWQEKLYND